jgi:hypothetical protein
MLNDSGTECIREVGGIVEKNDKGGGKGNGGGKRT